MQTYFCITPTRPVPVCFRLCLAGVTYRALELLADVDPSIWHMVYHKMEKLAAKRRVVHESADPYKPVRQAVSNACKMIHLPQHGIPVAGASSPCPGKDHAPGLPPFEFQNSGYLPDNI